MTAAGGMGRHCYRWKRTAAVGSEDDIRRESEFLFRCYSDPVDGYSGFKGLLENRPPGEVRLAFCWAHCRRRFYEFHQATGSPLAEEALRRIGELYAVEAEIRGRPAEERRTVRQERSRPIVDALHAWLTV